VHRMHKDQVETHGYGNYCTATGYDEGEVVEGQVPDEELLGRWADCHHVSVIFSPWTTGTGVCALLRSSRVELHVRLNMAGKCRVPIYRRIACSRSRFLPHRSVAKDKKCDGAQAENLAKSLFAAGWHPPHGLGDRCPTLLAIDSQARVLTMAARRLLAWRVCANAVVSGRKRRAAGLGRKSSRSETLAVGCGAGKRRDLKETTVWNEWALKWEGGT
jgi:hypothetical protein